MLPNSSSWFLANTPQNQLKYIETSFLANTVILCTNCTIIEEKTRILQTYTSKPDTPVNGATRSLIFGQMWPRSKSLI